MTAPRLSYVFVRVCITCVCLCVAIFSMYSIVSASENDFFRTLSRKDIATNEDVLRAAARFRGYKGADGSAAELAYLQNLNVKMPRVLIKYPKRPSTKGSAANVFLNAMGSSADARGLFGRLFSGSRRYASRDAMSQKLLPRDSIANEFISGGELLAMLGRAVEQTGDK